MKTLKIFTELIELLLGAYKAVTLAISEAKIKAALKKAEETKDSTDIENIINK